MTSELYYHILLLVCLLLLSGFFSGSETALFSLGAVHKRRISTSKTATDRALLWLLSSPSRLIVTLLMGNELVNIAIATVVAAMIHKLAGGLSTIQLSLLSMAAAVPLLLLFGEVTPKTIAIKIPEGWSRAVARPLRVFSIMITPIRWIVRTVADTLINLLGGRPPPRERPLSEEEFRQLVEAGSARGQLEKAEKDLINNVFEFGERTVADVMTAYDDVFALSSSLPLDRIVAEVVSHRFSRVPIYTGKKSQVMGLLYAKDLVGFGHVLELTGKPLRKLMRKPFYVPRSTKCARLFREFQERRIHIAVVVNEYGRMIGLATMEDLLEEIFGELVDVPGDGKFLGSRRVTGEVPLLTKDQLNAAQPGEGSAPSPEKPSPTERTGAADEDAS